MKIAQISKIRIYPIKSLGHIELEAVEIGIHSLENDRLFAMIDENRRYMNGKRNPKVNQLQTEYDLQNGLVTFSDKTIGDKQTFELRENNEELNDYLSRFFDTPLQLVKNETGSFMDIPFESSLTVVSEASLQALQKDLDRHSLENMRLRFRTNIELSGVDAFWEEKLYLQPNFGMRFKIGEVDMIGVSPRARCNVPPQNPDTGEMDYHFVKNMIESRNNHKDTANKVLQYGRSTYFLTVNVFLPKEEVGKKLQLGDKIEILDVVGFQKKS